MRDAAASDEPEWRRLWTAYNGFHGHDLSATITAATWRKILDPAIPVSARVVVREGGLAGFCICVLHDCTWTPTPVCYLEDLYVDADRRGSGIGRALIQDAVDRAREGGLSRVYWHTKADNAEARRLYESFVPADAVVRYTLGMS